MVLWAVSNEVLPSQIRSWAPIPLAVGLVGMGVPFALGLSGNPDLALFLSKCTIPLGGISFLAGALFALGDMVRGDPEACRDVPRVARSDDTHPYSGEDFRAINGNAASNNFTASDYWAGRVLSGEERMSAALAGLKAQRAAHERQLEHYDKYGPETSHFIRTRG